MSAQSRRQKLEAMLADDPNDPFLNYGLAMESVSEGKDEDALQRFQHLMSVAPDYVPGYQQAGQALCRLGRVEEARAILTRGIETARKQGEQHPADEMQGLLDTIN